MIIIGAKGLAKEVLEIYHERDSIQDIMFYDDVSNDLPDLLYDKFKIIRSFEDAIKELEKDNQFTLGLGVPLLRHKLYNKFSKCGGQLVSSISLSAKIGSYGTVVEEGCTVLMGAVITNGVNISKGVLINPNCTISHDVTIGEFAELSPGAQLTGSVSIGAFCQIGTNATILPKVNLGNNVIVGAGAVVTKDVPDNSLVVGVPARIIRKLPLLH